jgi:hypothetical protein
MKPHSNRIGRLFIVAVILSLVVSIYLILSAVTQSNRRGTLFFQSSDSNATLSITQNNKQAIVIGVGQSKALLLPGTYLVSSSDKGQLATKVVSIVMKKTTKIMLDPSSEVFLPSLLNIKFNNIGNFINFGLTNQQVISLEQSLFKFNPDAKTINIDSGSIENGPHNASTSNGFVINFNLTIDNTPYKGSVNYNDITHVQLTLSDPQKGNVVYDSGPQN